MNQHDSDRMAEVLKGAGYRRVEDIEHAEVVLLNTCSVRDKAEHKLRSEVGRLGVLKRTRPDLVIGVAGCVAQQEGARLLKQLPQIDLMIGPDNIPELPGLLAAQRAAGTPQVRTEFDVGQPNFLAHALLEADGESTLSTKATAFVTVMKGCNERCSFCIVPHTRGPERYRPSGEILDEIAQLTRAGVREVTLLGQTVNSYLDPSRRLTPALSSDTGNSEAGNSETVPWKHTRSEHARLDESEFSALLRAIAKQAPSLARLRYTSPHPRHLTRSLIRAHQDLPVLVRHVHMPVQSGSDRVLRRMIRRYSAAEYVERVDALKQAVSGLSLSTDIIVGFPGETRYDFEQTLALVERVGFVGVFGFKYSPRPFTPALRLGDDVAETEKSRRLAELFELSNTLRQRHLAKLVGSEQLVLVESRGKARQWSGRTERNEIVHFAADSELGRQLVRVRITQANKNSLLAVLVGPSAEPLPSSPGGRRRLPVLSA